MPSETISLSHASYEIIVESGVLQRVGQQILIAGLSGRAAIISDTNVAPLYLSTVEQSLASAGYETTAHVFPAGEASKSMTQVEALSRSLMQEGHDRSSFVVVLGGGVAGDLAGFVASIYYRGIPFVQIPTTIVSQVDSSVGGKTGVNTPEGKNLLGVFHQPSLVVIDPTTLTSLPLREYREGFAEVIKHAAIRDATMLPDLEQLSPDDAPPPAALLLRNLAIKARIVEEDEKELSGTRALLNFGHTLGHAIEASVPYGSLLHGEAISLGIRAALYLSENFAGLPASESRRLLALLSHFGLPTQLEDSITTELLLEKMKRDKKFSQGSQKFVLLRATGDAFVSAEVTTDGIIDAIEHLRTPMLSPA